MEGFTYSELEQALKDWSEENSEAPNEYAENIPRIVQLAELRVVVDLNLEIFDITDTTAVVTAGDRLVPKPAGILVLRSMRLITAGVRSRITARSNDFCDNYALDPSVTDVPKYYAEYSDSMWTLAPVPADNASLETRGLYRPSSLVDEETTWLGDNVGQLIFAASLIESEDFLKADDRAEDYMRKYQELLGVARLELRQMIRTGDYTPFKSSAKSA